MRWRSFSGTLGFGVIATAASLVCATALQPFVGSATAAELCLVVVAAVYAAGLAGSRAVCLGTFSVMTAFGVGVVALGPGLEATAIALSALLGVARSGVFRATRAVRGLAIEAALIAGGLGLAAALIERSLISFGLALWGFFLVQSLFFLIPGRALFRGPETGVDAFAQAMARAEALLGRDGL